MDTFGLPSHSILRNSKTEKSKPMNHEYSYGGASGLGPFSQCRAARFRGKSGRGDQSRKLSLVPGLGLSNDKPTHVAGLRLGIEYVADPPVSLPIKIVTEASNPSDPVINSLYEACCRMQDFASERGAMILHQFSHSFFAKERQSQGVAPAAVDKTTAAVVHCGSGARRHLRTSVTGQNGGRDAK